MYFSIAVFPPEAVIFLMPRNKLDSTKYNGKGEWEGREKEK